MGIRTIKMEEANGLDESKVDSIHFDREKIEELSEMTIEEDGEELAAELDDI
jgi:hypothetical protein